MLLLGGFSIAGALSKFGIAKSMATFVLSKAGTRPNRVLLVNMMVATVASMWISNVAAPVLCFSLIQVKFCIHVCLLYIFTILYIYMYSLFFVHYLLIQSLVRV
jgi:hypothetical protein